MTVQRFARNIAGRDFAAGDTHGEFDELAHALDEIRFDGARDRLFLVGDLVDRGRHSRDALDWLRRPGIHSLLGNHEEMFLALYRDREPKGIDVYLDTDRNGRAWWRDIGEDVRAEFLALWRTLPLAFEIETATGRVGMTHAEVPIGWDWPMFCEYLAQNDSDTRHSALWERKRAQWGDATGVPGIDRLLVGHTPVARPCALGNVVYLDTGLVYGREGYDPQRGRLTVVELTASIAQMTVERDIEGFLDLRLA